MGFKKRIIAVAISGLAITTSTVATANEGGLYFGNGITYELSSIDNGTSGLFYNVYLNSKDAGTSWYGDMSFTSYGLGAGYNYVTPVKNLDVIGGLGFGISKVTVDGSNLETDSESGLTYQVGVSYSLKDTIDYPVNVSARLFSIPEWAYAGKTYGGGTSVIVGASYSF